MQLLAPLCFVAGEVAYGFHQLGWLNAPFLQSAGTVVRSSVLGGTLFFTDSLSQIACTIATASPIINLCYIRPYRRSEN